ncbi:Na(+)/H(+) antiporter subunit B [Streptomyces sp. NPDC059740]|uniref:Na(+)/H(+) antiporter subunit B n=1 Tax=Streptomyces sp. NPDC059740 TaxID=3346926 RepID=UPI003658998C
MSGATATETLSCLALLLVAVVATVAVLTRDPVRQAVVLGVLGLALTLLFTFLQAPDVALSELVVGTALTPLLILLAVRRVRRDAVGDPAESGEAQNPDGRTAGEPGAPRRSGPRPGAEG